MIKINENTLRNDLLYTYLVLGSYPSKSFIKDNYDDFVSLFLTYDEFYKSKIEYYNVYNKPNNFALTQLYAQRFIIQDYNEYINKVKRSIVPIINSSSSICDIMFDLDFYSLNYYDALRRYSEKDFKDLILGYYSTYGNEYYKIAKKYFDENRIQFGENDPSFEKYLLDDKTNDEEENTSIESEKQSNSKRKKDDDFFRFNTVGDLLEGLKIVYSEDEENNE